MTIAARSDGFADSFVARILAMILAVVIGGFLYFNWSAEIANLLTDNSSSMSVVSESQPAKEANDALAACLEQRIGDVERMKKEGILSDAQYNSFSIRAADLCQVQNPG